MTMTMTKTKTVTVTKKTMPSSLLLLLRLKTLFLLLVVSCVLLSLATITLDMKLNHHYHYNHNQQQLPIPTLKLWKELSVLQKLASEETAETTEIEATTTEATETGTTRKTKSQYYIRSGRGGDGDGRGRGRGRGRDRTTIQQPDSSSISSSSNSGKTGEVGNEAIATNTVHNVIDITPTECHDVRRYVENHQWEDPNKNNTSTNNNNNNNNNHDGHHSLLLARNVITDPQFAISVHNRQYDRVRYSSIYLKGDYYEKKVRNRFLFILKEEEESEEMQPETEQEEIDNNRLDHHGQRRRRRTPFVIDVGGNIGYYSLLSASLNHHVVTFEINPANLIRLCESIQLNLDPKDKDSIQVENVKPLLLHLTDPKRQRQEEEENGRQVLSYYPFSKDSIEIYRYAVSNQPGQSLEVDIPKRNPGEAHVVNIDNNNNNNINNKTNADRDVDSDDNNKSDADSDSTIDTLPTLNRQAGQDGHESLPGTASTTTAMTTTMKTTYAHQDIATLRHAQVMTITLDMFATQQGWLLLNNGSSSNENNEDSSSTSTTTTTTKLPPLSPPQSPPSISILKIDTEGHEPQIIEGSKRLLQSGLVKNVLMEYRPATCRSAVIDILLEAGYGIVYENIDRQILTLLGREASETYLDPYRPGAAAHRNDPRKGLSSTSSSSSSSKTAATRTSSSSETTSTAATTSTNTTTGGSTTKKSSFLDDGYEDLWFRLLSNPLPPSAARKYWSLG